MLRETMAAAGVNLSPSFSSATPNGQVGLCGRAVVWLGPAGDRLGVGWNIYFGIPDGTCTARV